MLLSVERVSKTYHPPPKPLRPLVRTAARQPVEALSEVSFGVDAGEVVGLVGPNGAGKTSLIRIISGLLAQSSGSVTVSGYDTGTRRIQANRLLGLVLEGDRGLYPRLTGLENLEFFGRMNGLSTTQARASAGELLEMVDLATRDKLVFGYSAGMRARLSLARALINDPLLVVLDEPTRSMDPVASESVRQLLLRLAADGRAVLVSNHRLEEVVSVCSRVVALVKGTVRYDGRPRDLSQAHEGQAAALSAFLLRESAA